MDLGLLEWPATKSKGWGTHYLVSAPLQLVHHKVVFCHHCYTYCTRTVVAIVNPDIITFADDAAVISLLKQDETEHGTVLVCWLVWMLPFSVEYVLDQRADLWFQMRGSFSHSDSDKSRGDSDGYWVQIPRYHWPQVILGSVCWRLKRANNICIFSGNLIILTLITKCLLFFYKFFIESIVSYCVLCWYGHSKITHRNKLGKIVKTCETIIGKQPVDLYHLYLTRLAQKEDKVCMDKTYSLSVEFMLLRSGCRYRYPNVRTNRVKTSFIAMAITQLN